MERKQRFDVQIYGKKSLSAGDVAQAIIKMAAKKGINIEFFEITVEKS